MRSLCVLTFSNDPENIYTDFTIKQVRVLLEKSLYNNFFLSLKSYGLHQYLILQR
jgi:hypothetical protein